MSTGDAQTKPDQHDPLDLDTLSSQSLFNKSSYMIDASKQAGTQVNVPPLEQMFAPVDFNHEQLSTITSLIHHLQFQVHNQNKILLGQRLDIEKLHQTMHDLSKDIHNLHSITERLLPPAVFDSRPTSPQVVSTTSSIDQCIESPLFRSPSRILPVISNNAQEQSRITMLHNTTSATRTDCNRLLRDAVEELNSTLKHNNSYFADIQHDIRELRRSLHESTPHVTQASHTPVSVPSNNIAATSSYLSPTSASTAAMSFTLPLSNTFPTFSGKEYEMPTKFITEFEIRASSLVGKQDDQLLRAVRHCLTDIALTWFAQIEQERSINTWNEFKTLFLRRFRTPEKIELLRARLHSLWQSDNEPVADFYEHLKSLLSEIDPSNSDDYLKRKFLQKLRKDIRDKMTLGLSSSLSDIVQKALEVEAINVQQKIDDKLRAAHKKDGVDKNIPNTINPLQNSFKSTSFSPISDKRISAGDTTTVRNYNNNSSNRNNYSRRFGNNHTRTFRNSIASYDRSFPSDNLPRYSHAVAQSNPSTRLSSSSGWCSDCPRYGCHNSPHSNKPHYVSVPNDNFQSSRSSVSRLYPTDDPNHNNQRNSPLPTQNASYCQQPPLQSDYNSHPVSYSSSQQFHPSENI